MSWISILALSGGAYLFKLVGLFAGDHLTIRVARVTRLLPAALFSAIIVTMSFTDGDSLVLDGRLIGLAVGILAVWRRAPFVVTVLSAMAATAFLRFVS